ncbi:MAG: beta-glucoside-specific PTS transporter subunit IIABC [Atopobiaceae bacterium]|jgi:PTS system beta-glucosides-specific IIC component|nr:beta-glucoside-specific PTS transporter subunit IIABC [Atopobiaceae bacterium]MCI2172649.1 beta-glucoside-specific PTS transporter subunit IIABC [Atopobiaceae bacterium]MCI2206956.1 beta-glucoside-specific PTS transporter subunit IIABC [Atopobiaceae bacterium]
MSHESEGSQILELVGGRGNIHSVVHCATRLRFELNDAAKADKDKIEALPYVLKVIESGGQFQVVIGPAVHDYYVAVMDAAGMTEDGTDAGEPADGKKAKQKPTDVILKVISGSFSPIIPLMAGSGMIKAVLTLLVTLGWLSDASSTYLVLSAAGNACFYFLPVFLGYTISKQLGADPFVGAAIGAALLEPNFTSLIGAEDSTFLGLGLQAVDYGSTVFPIFIAIIIYSFLYKGLHKVVQRDLQYFVLPMVSLIVMVPFTALVFGPFGNNIGNVVAMGVSWLFENSKFLAGLILGAVYPYLTILGLHWGFTPITLQNLDLLGGDYIEGVAVCAVWAQIGIALGVVLKARKGSKARDLAMPTLITGFFAGVTEPILYGLVMNYKRLMAVVAIAGACGGAWNATFGVTMDSYVFHNIFSVATMCYSPMPMFLIGIAISCGVSAALTYFWGITDDEKADFLPMTDGTAAQVGAAPAIVTGGSDQPVELEVKAPVNGKLIPLADVHDDVFASGSVGRGVAIVPEGDTLCAPCDGTLTMLFKTKHALGITTPEGVELMIHIGIDTVNLDGEGFEALVEQGDVVKAGQPLMKLDLDFFASKGICMDTPIVVSNFDKVQDVVPVEPGEVTTGEKVMTVTM